MALPPDLPRASVDSNPAAPTSGPGVAAPAPPRRRRVLRTILFVFLALFVGFAALVAGGIYYVQTESFFARFVLPAARKAWPGTIEVASGSVGFGGVRLEGLVVSDPEGGEFLRGDRLVVDVDFRSVLRASRGRGLPVVERIVIDRFAITGRPDILGTGGEPELELPEEEAPEPAPRKEGPHIPVIVRSLEVSDCSFDWVEGGRERLSLSGLNISMKNLAPGEKSDASVRASLAVAPGDEATRRAGELKLDLTMDQTPDGLDFSWDAALDVAMTEGPAPGPGLEFERVALSGRTNGLLKGLDHVKADLETLTRVGERDTGTIDASFDFARGTMAGDSRVELAGVSPDIANLVLAATGDAQIVSGVLDGKIGLAGDEDLLEAAAGIRVTGASIRPAPGESATPPSDLVVDLSGSFASRKEEATISAVRVQLLEKGATAAEVKLDQPVVIRTAELSGGAAGASEMPDAARLGVKLDGVDVEDVRPWLTAFRIDALDDVREGSASGDLVIDVAEAGDRLEVAGDVRIESVKLRQEGRKELLGPLLAEGKVRAKATERKRFDVQPSSVRLALDGSELVRADVSGTYDLDAGVADLEAKYAAPNLSDALERLGALEGELPAKPGGGKVDGGARIARKGKEAPFHVVGSTKVAGLKLTTDAGTFQQNVDSDYDLTFDPDKGRLDLARFVVALADAGTELLKFDATGSVDTKEGGLSLDAKYSSANVTAAVERTGVLEGELPARPGEGALSGSTKIARAGKDAPISLVGRTVVEGLSLTGDHGSIRRTADADYSLRLDLAGGLAEFDRVVVALADSSKNPAGRIAASGKWPTSSGSDAEGKSAKETKDGKDAAPAKSHAGSATIDVAELDAKPWLDFFGVEAAKDVERAPVTANLKVEMDAGGERFRFGGEERIGPLVLRDAKGDASEVVLVIRNSAEKIRENVQGLVVDLSAKRPGGEDRLRIEGSARLPEKEGARPALTATISSDAFDAGFYADRIGSKGRPAPAAAGASGAASATSKGSASSGGSSSGTSASAAKGTAAKSSGTASKAAAAWGDGSTAKSSAKSSTSASKSEPAKSATASTPATASASRSSSSASKAKAPSEFPADLDATFRFGSVRYRDVTLEGIAGSVKSDKATLTAVLDSLRMAGGQMKARAEMRRGVARPDLAWTAEGSGIDTARAVASFRPDLAGKIEGIASFSTEGLGYPEEEDMKRTLRGTVLFDVRDGKLKNSELMQVIADATGSSDFEQMVFQRFHGDVALADGRADLRDVRALGSATKIVAAGWIGLDSTLDFRVQPGVSRQISDRLPSSDVRKYGKLVEDADGFLNFPLSVRVSGDAARPKYGVAVEAGTLLDSAVGIGKELLGDRLGEHLGDSSDPNDPLGAVGGIVDNLVGGLTGRKTPAALDPKASPTPAPGGTPKAGATAPPKSGAAAAADAWGGGTSGSTTGKPGPTPTPDPAKQIRDAVGGVVGDLLGGDLLGGKKK